MYIYIGAGEWHARSGDERRSAVAGAARPWFVAYMYIHINVHTYKCIGALWLELLALGFRYDTDSAAYMYIHINASYHRLP